MNILIAGDYFLPKNNRNREGSLEIPNVDKDILDIINSADYSIVNFESSVVLGKNEYPIVKNGVHLASGRESLEILKGIGFKMITLANNHVLDYGYPGLSNTLSISNKEGLEHVGAGHNFTEASSVRYIDIGGERAAFVNCCEHEFSISENDNPGSCPLDPILQYYQINQAKKESDYVIIIVHGGHEYFQLPSQRMVLTYRYLIDAGADAVINHHQHCYSGYEVYKEKPIFYGLGNFFFYKESEINRPWNEGYMVKLHLSKEQVDFEIFPYRQCNGNYGVESLNDSNSFYIKIKQLNETISSSEKLDKAIKIYYDSLRNFSLENLEPYNSKICKKLHSWGILPSFVKRKPAVLLNHIDCESHRDVLTYELKQMINNDKW